MNPRPVQRLCRTPGCRTVLARDNREAICSPCQARRPVLEAERACLLAEVAAYDEQRRSINARAALALDRVGHIDYLLREPA